MWDDRCPDRYQAERAGRDRAHSDFDFSGYRSYGAPYECDEANRQYRDAYDSEWRYQEDRADEERAARARQERLAEERRQEEDAYWYAMQQDEQRYPSGPMCDICGTHEACASSNGYNVCSEGCDAEARSRGVR